MPHPGRRQVPARRRQGPENASKKRDEAHTQYERKDELKKPSFSPVDLCVFPGGGGVYDGWVEPGCSTGKLVPLIRTKAAFYLHHE